MPKTSTFNEIVNHYKLPIVALCFLISVGSNLVFSQGSFAFDALAWTCTVALVGVVLGLTLPRSAHSYLLFVILDYRDWETIGRAHV